MSFESIEQRPGGILMALPPELRDTVYRFLLTRDEPIPIRTPRQRTFKDLCLSNARGSILYVNKNIHEAALHVFFAKNTFVVGNGIGEEASLEGLRAFTKYIPAESIAKITKVHLHVYLRRIQDPFQRQQPRLWDFNAYSTIATTTTTSPPRSLPDVEGLDFSDMNPIPFNTGDRVSMGSPAEALEIRQLYRCVRKYFIGITSLTVDWPVSSNKVDLWPGRILPKAAIVTVLSKAIATFMVLPELRKICMWEDECVSTSDILGQLLIVGSGMGKSMQFEHLRYKEGVSGRIRMEVEDMFGEQREIHLWWDSGKAIEAGY